MPKYLQIGYYGGLDELIKIYDLGEEYILDVELLLSSVSVIEGHNK